MDDHDFQTGILLKSISINVNAFGLWEMLLGTKRCLVKITGCTLQDLIVALNDRCTGTLASEVLMADGGLDPKFKIFVNGNVSQSLSTKLTDGDEVLLFSVIDGG